MKKIIKLNILNYLYKIMISRIFKPSAYIEQYYSDVKGHQLEPDLKYYEWYHKIFDALPKCQLCLEIGSGPVVLMSAYASRIAQKIILTEFNVDCFQPIESWLKDESILYMDDHFQFMARQETREAKDIKSRLRKAILMMGKCDLTQDKILSFNYLTKVDLIITSLCIEAVATSVEEYSTMINKIAHNLKPKGHIVIFGVLEQTFYKVGEQTLPCLSLTQKDIQASLIQNGFNLLLMEVDRQEVATQVSDFKGIFCCLAQLQ